MSDGFGVALEPESSTFDLTVVNRFSSAVHIAMTRFIIDRQNVSFWLLNPVVEVVRSSIALTSKLSIKKSLKKLKKLYLVYSKDHIVHVT